MAAVTKIEFVDWISLNHWGQLQYYSLTFVASSKLQFLLRERETRDALQLLVFFFSFFSFFCQPYPEYREIWSKK